MQFKDIGGNVGALVDMDPSDLLLLAKVCRATLAGDFPDHEQTTVDAMGAAFEAAALCLWMEGEIIGPEGLTLAALRNAGSIGAAMQERERNEKNGK